MQRFYFDGDKNDSYNSLVPEYIDKIMETVVFAYNASIKKVCVPWDLDGRNNYVKVNDITTEAKVSIANNGTSRNLKKSMMGKL